MKGLNNSWRLQGTILIEIQYPTDNYRLFHSASIYIFLYSAFFEGTTYLEFLIWKHYIQKWFPSLTIIYRIFSHEDFDIQGFSLWEYILTYTVFQKITSYPGKLHTLIQDIWEYSHAGPQ